MESGAVRAAEPGPLPEVASMLAALDSGFPDVTTLTAPELRAIIRSRRAPLQWLPAMRDVSNLTVDGPGGPLPIRVYRPRHDASALPVIVFAHGGGFVFCDLDSHDELCRAMAEGVGGPDKGPTPASQKICSRHSRHPRGHGVTSVLLETQEVSRRHGR
ncbi:alpha/beta hydrolase fold domain-containing protein [Nocardia fusca]|uniref:alpha/beta hydrolase fold domain-containing protein n=1 Tax=Nocardia fusca TaxID=941183 RepID=UPI0037C5C1EF